MVLASEVDALGGTIGIHQRLIGARWPNPPNLLPAQADFFLPPLSPPRMAINTVSAICAALRRLEGCGGLLSRSEDEPAEKDKSHHQQSADHLGHANNDFGQPDSDLDGRVKNNDGDKCVEENGHGICVWWLECCREKFSGSSVDKLGLCRWMSGSRLGRGPEKATVRQTIVPVARAKPIRRAGRQSNNKRVRGISKVAPKQAGSDKRRRRRQPSRPKW